MRIPLNMGDLGEDVECEVTYNYRAAGYSENPYDYPEGIELVELFIVPWAAKIDVKFLAESAVEYVEYKISEYERKRA